MSSDDERDFPRDWFRGVLEPCLLALLAEGEAYGFDLAGRLRDAGMGPVAGGTLYPALLRLEKQGLVSARWQPGDGGPGRKYYELTEAGRRAGAANAARWDAFSASVAGLLAAGVAR